MTIISNDNAHINKIEKDTVLESQLKAEVVKEIEAKQVKANLFLEEDEKTLKTQNSTLFNISLPSCPKHINPEFFYCIECKELLPLYQCKNCHNMVCPNHHGDYNISCKHDNINPVFKNKLKFDICSCFSSS